jgi:hypothetical protein
LSIYFVYLCENRKNETFWNYFKKGIGGNEGNDGLSKGIVQTHMKMSQKPSCKIICAN